MIETKTRPDVDLNKTQKSAKHKTQKSSRETATRRKENTHTQTASSPTSATLTTMLKTLAAAALRESRRTGAHRRAPPPHNQLRETRGTHAEVPRAPRTPRRAAAKGDE
jgi:hypothetical protein